jgi:hypothetical protein
MCTEYQNRPTKMTVSKTKFLKKFTYCYTVIHAWQKSPLSRFLTLGMHISVNLDPPVAVSLRLQVKATSSNPTSWEPEFVTPTHSAKEAPPCFAGSRRHRRSPDERLGELERKKLLRA